MHFFKNTRGNYIYFQAATLNLLAAVNYAYVKYTLHSHLERSRVLKTPAKFSLRCLWVVVWRSSEPVCRLRLLLCHVLVEGQGVHQRLHRKRVELGKQLKMKYLHHYYKHIH
jgi:hypothetical protein